MVDQVPPDLADKMIDALGSNDKARALLLYHRAGGADLETAWKVVQQMMRDLGEEGDLPAKPSQDPSFREVKEYLTLDRPARWRRFLGTMALALLCCGFPGYVLLGKSARLKTSLQSLFWSSTQATITEVRTYSKRSFQQQRQVDRDYQDFSYRYEVDGKEYTGFRGRLQYYPALGDEPLKTGDPISIFYDPAEPGRSLYERKIYQLTVTLLFNLGIVGFGILVAIFAWSRERRWRQLHRMDRHLPVSPAGEA
ncbi:MAG: DUF3592 domain-containing protein [Acidobacteriota bacterium]|nr:DUF3592 domain-containing protein [Acidobacteriota bacterium]